MDEVSGTGPAPRSPGRLLTVGIPVFNGKSLLRDCLQSVVDSTLPRDRFEIVVADDGSTEPETLAILAEFETRLADHPGFFRVITLESNSGGAARPRNHILDAATGEYVFFVDSDDTIGNLALARIAEALTATPVDWVAVHQVPVNGRAGVCTVRQRQIEVPRSKALATLTVHKVFRRAEIERQQLRFDEGLPSGQDLTFAFSYLLNAERFLMLGEYDFYYLMRHAGNPDEPVHLSRRARTPAARIEKNERILRSMLTALHRSDLPEPEQRTIVGQICLPRVLLRQGYLKAVVNAGPKTGARALRRLRELLSDRLVAELDPAELREVSEKHLAVINRADWTGLALLVGPAAPQPRPWDELTGTLLRRGRRLVAVASGRVRHRRVMHELASLRRLVKDVRDSQRELETALQTSVDQQRKAQRRFEVNLLANLVAEIHLRDMLATGEPRVPEALTPRNPGWQLSPQAMREVVRHVLTDHPGIIVECGSGASTMWIARALRRAGQGRLISLEDSAEWVTTVTGLLLREGLGDAEVRHAPLRPVQVGQVEQPWYSTSAVDDLDEIGLLLVDGPPGNTNNLARYPALPTLRDKLRPGATIMLDDCDRRDEKETLRRWLDEIDGLSLVRRVDNLAVLKLG